MVQRGDRAPPLADRSPSGGWPSPELHPPPDMERPHRELHPPGATPRWALTFTHEVNRNGPVSSALRAHFPVLDGGEIARTAAAPVDPVAPTPRGIVADLQGAPSQCYGLVMMTECW